jgi:hypothetical protein
MICFFSCTDILKKILLSFSFYEGDDTVPPNNHLNLRWGYTYRSPSCKLIEQLANILGLESVLEHIT